MSGFAKLAHSLLASEKVATLEFDHPEVAAPALWAWTKAVLWCSQNETDGDIPRRQLESMVTPFSVAGEATDALLASGLVEAKSKQVLRLVSYLEHNLSREQINERRRVRARAGRSGGISSGKARSSRLESPEANHEANASLFASTMDEAKRNQPVSASASDLRNSQIGVTREAHLLVAWRAEVEAHTGHPTPTIGPANHQCIQALDAYAERLDAPFREVCHEAAARWIQYRKSDGFPRFSYFERDIGEVLEAVGRNWPKRLARAYVPPNVPDSPGDVDARWTEAGADARG